jgi:translation initiation factor IF-3
MHRAVEFLEEGDRIKVTVRFRGRELSHPELGRMLLERFTELVKEHGVIERTPVLEGKSMFIVLASTHKPKVAEAPHRPDRPDGVPAPVAAADVAEPAPATTVAAGTPAATPAATPGATAPAPTAAPKAGPTEPKPTAPKPTASTPTNGAEAPQTASPAGD